MRVLFAQTLLSTVFSLQVNANQFRQLDSQKAFDRLLDVAVEYESETLGIGNKMEIRNLILQRIENDGFESAIINPMNKLILNNQIVRSKSLETDLNTLAMSKMLPGGFEVDVKVDVKVKVPPQKDKQDKPKK